VKPPVSRHFTITGSVQGVGYRWSMVAEATRLGLDGWVRNRRDGSVEALARGDETALALLAEWTRRGPAGAVVQAVAVRESQEVPPQGFHQHSTV
jgi:acylphosphatase